MPSLLALILATSRVSSPKRAQDEVLVDFRSFSFKCYFILVVFTCVAGRCCVATLATQHIGARCDTIQNIVLRSKVDLQK